MSEIGVSELEESNSIDSLNKIKSMGLSEQDFEQINQHGVSSENIQKQLAIFKKELLRWNCSKQQLLVVGF